MPNENRGILHRERFVKLQVEFDELVRLGGAGPEDFRTLAFRLMKAFENSRLKNENQISKLQAEISFCQATSRACDLFENLLVGLVTAHKDDKIKGLNTKITSQYGEEVPTDIEVLKSICICGCRDEEDSKDCSCSCHRGIPCGLSNCVVCAAKQSEIDSIIDIPDQQIPNVIKKSLTSKKRKSK